MVTDVTGAVGTELPVLAGAFDDESVGDADDGADHGAGDDLHRLAEGDMGIGFGKDYEDNLTLIKNIKRLKRQDVMLLTALSNKRVIKAASHSDAENCLFGTIAADTAAVFGGTDMIRVHEVNESKIAADMADAIFRG